MAYVEVHQELDEHPKFKRFMRLLAVSRREAKGILIDLWQWAMDYAADGDLSRYDSFDIADGAKWEGDADTLVNALCKCGIGDGHGFIECDDSGKRLHDWEQYGGKLHYAKEREAYLAWLKRRGKSDGCEYPDTPGNFQRWKDKADPVLVEPREANANPASPVAASNSPETTYGERPSFVGGMSDRHRADAYISRAEQSREERSGDQQQQREAGPSGHEPTGAEPKPPDLPAVAFAPLSPDAPDALLPDCGELTSRLVAAGVNASDASRLAHTKPLVCLRQLEFVPFVKEFKTGPGAYLRSAIENDYAPPKAYLDAQKRKVDDERRALEKAQRAEQEKRIQQEKALLDAEVKRLQALPDEWQKIVEEASAKVPPDMKPNLRQGTIDGKVRRIVFERMQAQSQTATGAVMH